MMYLHTSSMLFLGLARFVIVASFWALPVLTSPASSLAQAPPPAGSQQNSSQPWTPVQSIDFSPKHNVLIRNSDGATTPMDVPYFKSTLIAPGTWQILSDGDYQYLIEGDNEALAIDAGYGAGNIREYMQTLTRKPVRYVANTHDHFDHTANDSYFDRAYMSAFTKAKATIPYPSFAGINFPRNYPIQVIGDGYVFHLGNRDVEVFEIPNHTMGDLAYLDRRSHILFSGDVFMVGNMSINPASSVARFESNLRKLAAHRSEFDRLAAGAGIIDASFVDKLLANAQYILAGHEGEPIIQQPRPARPPVDPNAPIIYDRREPRPIDMGGGGQAAPHDNLRKMTYADCAITYDIRHVEN